MTNKKLLHRNENKGLLILKQVVFEDCVKRTVIKNNSTSGKVNVPKRWIDKGVYVVLQKGGED